MYQNHSPPKWMFPLSLWPLLGEAKQQVGVLAGIARTLPNPGILIRPLENREALRSSRLEGTYVTAKELFLFEIESKDSPSKNDRENDQREILNYRKALQQGLASDLPFSLRFLRDLHRTLLSGVRGREKAPGEFRRGQVAIGSNHRFVPPPSHRLMECLDSLEKYFHSDQSYDPLVECFLIHYQFETIHPFYDGNGRVGRLLLAMMLKQRCGLPKPWLYMSEYYDNHREEYMQRLFDINTSADWSGWIEFCLKGVISQSKDTVERCDRLLILREEFMRRVDRVGGSVRLNKIVENLFRSPFLRIADLPSQLEVTYPTAKADVERLVEAGILEELKNVTPKTYHAPEVFNATYRDLD